MGEQDLKMARASCNADLLRTSLAAAREAGLSGAHIEAAACDLYALEKHSSWRPGHEHQLREPPQPLSPGHKSGSSARRTREEQAFVTRIPSPRNQAFMTDVPYTTPSTVLPQHYSVPDTNPQLHAHLSVPETNPQLHA